MATISEALAIAIAHHQAGRLQVAEQICRQILAAEPNQPDAWHLLGLVAHETGRHEVAVECLGHAVRLAGDRAAFHSSLGAAYRALDRIPEAIACYRRAVELNPDALAAHNSLGNMLNDQGKLDEAIACYRRALELNPDFAVVHNNLGNALKRQGKLDEAVACYRRALELKPDFAEVHNNLANVLKRQGKLDEAVACYRWVLKLKPDFAEVYNNLGTALKDQGKLDEAAACWRRALELKPDYAEAHHNQSLLLLLTGDFQRGWAEYAWRWKTKPWCDFAEPLWDGWPLEGRTILLHAEQGAGDAIQFVRYAALVKERGGTVVVECPKPLMSLLASCAGVDRLVGQGDEMPPCDVRVPLSGLPGIFHTTLGSIPAAIPYLFADPGLIGRWRAELDAVAGFKIGVFWQGTRRDPARIVPLSCFEPLAALPGVRLFSLQKGEGAEQLQGVAGCFPIMDLGSRLHDFMDTAAVLSALDLVITCDTAVAHLAGALDAAVWVAIPFAPDWRWLLDRDDSPWYPTMRLFRQKTSGDWAGVFERIKTALAARRASQA
jgi:tetratricopeptide (TPR) repeat protein